MGKFNEGDLVADTSGNGHGVGYITDAPMDDSIRVEFLFEGERGDIEKISEWREAGSVREPTIAELRSHAVLVAVEVDHAKLVIVAIAHRVKAGGRAKRSIIGGLTASIEGLALAAVQIRRMWLDEAVW